LSSSEKQVIHKGEKLSTAEIVTPVEAPAPIPSESNEVKQIQGYWKRLGLIVKKSEHWTTLSEHIHSFEDMDSLFKYTQAKIIDNPNASEKTVHPGNLVNCLNGWKQTQMALQTKSKVEGPKRLTAVEQATLNQQKYSAMPAPKIKPSEMFKQTLKKAALEARKA
jgi:hypothetical protein